MKRILTLIIPLSLLITACGTEKSPVGEPAPQLSTMYPESISIPDLAQWFDFTGTLDPRIDIVDTEIPTLTPVLTVEGLNMIPSSVFANVQQSTPFSSVRFDRFKPSGDIVRSRFRFTVSNVEAETFPIVSMVNYIKEDSISDYHTYIHSPLVNLSNSGDVSEQLVDMVEPNESFQYDVRVTSGEKSTIAANANDIIMTELLVESYQTSDADWNNANYSIDQWEFCAFDQQKLTVDFSLTSESATKTISSSIKVEGSEIALISAVLEPGKTSYDGFVLVNSQAYQGVYPFYISLFGAGNILLGLNFDGCLFESNVSNDLLDQVADSAYQTDLHMDFEAISELNPSTQAWNKLSAPNHPISTIKGLKLYPEGFDTLNSINDQSAITLPEVALSAETQIVRFHVNGLVDDIDVETCGRHYLSMLPLRNGDVTRVMIYPLTKQTAIDYYLLLFVSDVNESIRMQIDLDTRECQPTTDLVQSEVYITSVEVEQFAFKTHPLTKSWSVQLEHSGEACAGKKIDSDIALDISNEGTTLAMKDGSQLWVQLSESGQITWSWDVDGSDATARDDFFFGNSIWSTMVDEQGCLKRLSLYRDRSWLDNPSH